MSLQPIAIPNRQPMSQRILFAGALFAVGLLLCIVPSAADQSPPVDEDIGMDFHRFQQAHAQANTKPGSDRMQAINASQQNQTLYNRVPVINADNKTRLFRSANYNPCYEADGYPPGVTNVTGLQCVDLSLCEPDTIQTYPDGLVYRGRGSTEGHNECTGFNDACCVVDPKRREMFFRRKAMIQLRDHTLKYGAPKDEH